MEAKSHKAPIIACDMPFAHEILDDYDKVLFFDSFNSDDLCKSMIKIFSLEEKIWIKRFLSNTNYFI